VGQKYEARLGSRSTNRANLYPWKIRLTDPAGPTLGVLPYHPSGTPYIASL